MPKDEDKKPKEEEKKKDDEKKETAAPATIQVNLPAEAKLTIDGAATTSTSANRTFATPSLESGKEFFYTLTAEIVRDGKTLKATQVVSVRAGRETKVNIEMPEATVAAK
jgi:uncharacterized protein (TIGR03000 family)